MQLEKTMKYVLAGVVGTTMIVSAFAKDGVDTFKIRDEKNEGATVKAGKKDGPTNVNGISFDIAEKKSPGNRLDQAFKTWKSGKCHLLC